MAMKFKDGFDYLTAANFGLKWDSAPSGLSIVTGAYGNGKAAAISNGNTLPKTLGVNLTTFFFSFHFFNSSVAARTIHRWMDAGTVQVDLRCDATGALFFTRNGTTIGSVGAVGTRMTANALYWFCGQITIDASAGVAELKVNNSFVLNSGVTNLNTKNTSNAYINQVALVGNNLGSDYWDSYHIWDTVTTGGALGGYPAGEMVIDTKLPSGTGASEQWTQGGTTHTHNYQQVNEANEDGDTTYNASNTAGQIDSFAIGNLTASSGTIVDVAVNTIDRVDDGTTHVLKLRMKSSSTTVEDAGHNPTGSYLNHQAFFPQDPNASAAWSVSTRNAAEAAYDLVS